MVYKIAYLIKNQKNILNNLQMNHAKVKFIDIFDDDYCKNIYYSSNHANNIPISTSIPIEKGIFFIIYSLKVQMYELKLLSN